MIISGAIKEDRIYLSADSKASANAIKTALSGKNTHLSISPYGNQVEPYTEGINLIVRKHSGRSFTYEEVQSFLQKIEAIHRLTTETMHAILSTVRKDLNAQLTYFHPNTRTTFLEYSFCYNWASLTFHSGPFAQMFPDIRDALLAGGDPSLKVYTNNTNTVSVHNFTMNGIYISRKSFTAIGHTLAANNITDAASVEDIALRACAFGLRAVLYMEGRQHSAHQDETFSFDNIKPDEGIGDPVFLSKLGNVLKHLSMGTGFGGLSTDERQFLVMLAKDANSLDGYHLLNLIKHLTRRFLQDYLTDILSGPAPTKYSTSDSF